MNWAPFPFLRIALVLSTGIFLMEYFQLYNLPVYEILIVISILWLCYEIFVKSPISRSAIGGSFLLLTVFFLGGSLVKYTENQQNDGIIETSDNTSIYGVLEEKLKSGDRPRFVFRTRFVIDSNQVKTNNSLIVLTFDNDPISSDYDVGNLLYLKTKLSSATKNSNPFAFDYSKYLKYQGVLQVGFVRTGDHHLIADNDLSFLKKIAVKSSSFTGKVIQNNISGLDARAIAEALLIGRKYNIDDSIFQAYADTGAIHVLSVSGLHVAIFISVFILLFERVKSTRISWIITKVVSLLSIILFYVLLTGMAPSVVRAGTMVGIYVIGKTFFNKSSTYNAIALAAVMMLLYNPWYLFQVSFQLSFVSLLSILFFQPKISKWWIPDNRILKFCWDLVNVSLAAQILVFPFSVYFFHQLPLTFALSGLFAIPLVTLIIYGGSLMVIFFLFLKPLSVALGYILEIIITILNFLIKKTSEMPYSLIKDVNLTEAMVVFLLLGIVFMMYRLEYKKPTASYLALSCFLLVGIISVNDRVVNTGQTELIIYDMYGIDVLDFRNGKNIKRWVSDSIEIDKAYAVSKNYELRNYVEDVKVEGTYLFSTPNGLAYILSDKNDLKKLRDTLEVKFLFVAGKTYFEPQRVFSIIKPENIILSRNLSFNNTAKWLDLQLEMDVNIYSIREEGAFKYRFYEKY